MFVQKQQFQFIDKSAYTFGHLQYKKDSQDITICITNNVTNTIVTYN